MGGGDHPLGIDQHTSAPVTDEAEFGMQQLKGHLPRPCASLARLAVKNAAGGSGSRRGRDVIVQ